MTKWKTFAVGVAVGLVLGAGFLLRPTQANAKDGTLTAQDHVEIQQLYARYAQALDRSDGRAWAATFTPDGQIYAPPPGVIPGNGLLDGRQQIAAYVKGTPVERPSVRHVTSNILIEPTATGAKGTAYLLLTNLDGNPARLTGGGIYEDVIVKTSEGWRFKKRTYIAPKGAAAPAATPR